MANPSSELKSVGTVIAETLVKDTQQRVDQAMSNANAAVESVRNYATENPREAFVIALGLAAAGWALLYTRPGRVLFDQTAPKVIPQVTRWVSHTFS